MAMRHAKRQAEHDGGLLCRMGLCSGLCKTGIRRMNYGNVYSF